MWLRPRASCCCDVRAYVYFCFFITTASVSLRAAAVRGHFLGHCSHRLTPSPPSPDNISCLILRHRLTPLSLVPRRFWWCICLSECMRQAGRPAGQAAAGRSKVCLRGCSWPLYSSSSVRAAWPGQPDPHHQSRYTYLSVCGGWRLSGPGHPALAYWRTPTQKRKLRGRDLKNRRIGII